MITWSKIEFWSDLPKIQGQLQARLQSCGADWEIHGLILTLAVDFLSTFPVDIEAWLSGSLVHLTSSPLEDPFFPSIPISLQLSVGLFLRKVCCDKANMNRTGINSLVLLCLWGPVNTYTCCFWHIMNELWQKQPAVNVKQMSFLCESKCMNISHSSQVSQHDHKLCHKHVNAMLKTFCTIGSWRLLQKSSSFWNANISIKEGRHAEKPSDCSNSGTQIFRFIPEMMLWITDFTQQSDEWAAALWPYVPLIGMKWSCENPERQRLFITQIHQICE